ncbi:hypothetical protein [Mycobacterium leprae]|nr:hypothetical protein [Mycobacterium leprae]
MTTALWLCGLDVAAGTTVAVCLGTAAAAYGLNTAGTPDLHVLNHCGHCLLAFGRLSDCASPRRRAVDVVRGTTGHDAFLDSYRGCSHTALATLDAALRSDTCTRVDLHRAYRAVDR